MHGHGIQPRPCAMGMHRAGPGIQAWPCTARAFTAFRATVYFYMSLGRGQGVHGHGIYGQATARARATCAFAHTCAPPLKHGTVSKVQSGTFVLPGGGAQSSMPLISASMAFWSKPSSPHFTMVWSLEGGVDHAPRLKYAVHNLPGLVGGLGPHVFQEVVQLSDLLLLQAADA